MDNLKLIESLDEAIRILQKSMAQTSSGAPAIYLKAKHAQDHLNSQVKELLADPNPPAQEDHDLPF